jgi:hypothetical protein
VPAGVEHVAAEFEHQRVGVEGFGAAVHAGIVKQETHRQTQLQAMAGRYFGIDHDRHLARLPVRPLDGGGELRRPQRTMGARRCDVCRVAELVEQAAQLVQQAHAR